ncbi:MAG: hypothetical protein A2854_02485 [Parcubacteria group bacterium RIFCSPHIGHO2_01_FULL_56_18]|nr:MAG: hypothetical protein A2854_02485 [Parcubacteria group bacterium RIFCSPHIGHO2_01_FULL_56_18]
MRDALIISVLVVLILAAGIGVFFYTRTSAPEGQAPVRGDVVAFTELASGTQSSVVVRKNYLITSSGQLRELWKLIKAGGEPPAVDFSTHSVIAVFAGREPTGGYAISVTRVTDDTERMVSITTTSPGISCLVTESVTVPYQVIEIPATTLHLAHEDLVTTTSCLR